MAKIPLAIADLELQIATAIGVGDESFTLASATDDDGNALPAGIYCFTVDNGTSQKEYLLGQLNGVNVTEVKSVSRRGVETTGAARKHRIGAPALVTNFATLQRVADILRGVLPLNGASPIAYDTEPTLSDNKELATVGYVLSVVTGGVVSFDKQTIAGTAGATISAGDLVYFDESDQEWYLCDADTAATVEGVMRGIALGSGTDGVAITGGVHLSGAWTTTGLTAGSIYYASNTAGDLATSAGTVKHIVGVALSTTRLWVIPQHRETIPTRTKDALAGGGDFGTPSASNKFLTEQWIGFTPLIGGNGSDGVLNVTSGTTTLDLGGLAIFERNYESVNVSTGATLTFSNPHANGTVIRIKSRGNVTIAGTINAVGMGANGGAPAGTTAENGLNPNYIIGTENPRGIGASTSLLDTFGDRYTLTNFYTTSLYAPKTGLFYIVPGAGGGGGNSGNSVGGAGGRGGGAVYIECSGELTFTGTVNTSGQNGGDGATVSGNNGSGGGGGGGSAGMCAIRYGKLASNTGTILSAGGNGGNGGDRPDGSTTSGITAYGGGGAGSPYSIGGGRPNSFNASGLGAGGGGADGKRSGSGAGGTGGTGGGSMGGLVVPINY
jgi:hypothetical protein